MTGTAPPARAAADRLTLDGMRRGFTDTLYMAVFVAPWGLAYGAAATERGLELAAVLAISALVFAGASQFAALELWSSPLPALTIILTVIAVNARHLVMGAAMAPWALAVPPAARYGALGMMTDANWAYAMTRRARGESDLGVLVGSGVLLWLAWFAGTLAGALAGSQLGDPRVFGLDVLMLAYFTAMLAAQCKGSDDLAPWCVAAAVSVAGVYLLPKGWNVIAGALAGGVTGFALRPGRSHAD